MERRKFLKDSAFTVIGISAFGAINWNGKKFVGNNATTTDILGPYYRPGAPMRSNLLFDGSGGKLLNLSGTVFGSDGKTKQENVLVEVWHCDENQHYDNTSDEYRYRGAVKTGEDGRYAFKTIIPVPYMGGDTWRPAHIHMRVSSNHYQDLITQIYFKGDPHLSEDIASSNPVSAARILDITSKSNGEHDVNFDIVMGDSYPLDNASYSKVCGVYQLKDGSAEFTRQDDLLIMKLNGRIDEAMIYKGNNNFEGGFGYNRAKFEILPNGDVKTNITMWDAPTDRRDLKTYEGIKVLKYSY